MITKTEDVLDELYGIGVRPGGGDGEEAAGAPEQPEEPAPTGPAETVLREIEAGGGVDGACRASGLSAAEVRALLAQMEDSGRLRRDVLGAYVRESA